MDLYIRSQDKEALLKVNNGLMYWEDTDKRHTIVIKETSTNLSIMGAYKTKERALEVLDEIQGILNVKENLQFNGVDINDVFKDMDREKIRLMLYQMSVYEMPKE